MNDTAPEYVYFPGVALFFKKNVEPQEFTAFFNFFVYSSFHILVFIAADKKYLIPVTGRRDLFKSVHESPVRKDPFSIQGDLSFAESVIHAVERAVP